MSIRLEGYMQTTQQNAPLKRTMKTRHLIMLSLGGVIGTGLFFNTGYIISTTGAAGTLLAYLIGALVVWLVMQCLGELSVAMPLSWLPLISDYTSTAERPRIATAAQKAIISFIYDYCFLVISSFLQ